MSSKQQTKQTKKVVEKEVAPKKEAVPKKEKKETKKVEVEPEAVVSAPETVSAPAPETVEVAPKKAKKEKKVVVEPVATTQEVVATDATPAPVSAEPSVVDDFAALTAKLVQLGALVSSIRVDQRVLEKKIAKELKTAQKNSSRRKPKSGTRNPSGFVKPTLISDELASFLGKTTGTEMARTAVTKEINQYIRSNNLQDASNGRIIKPDGKLSALLHLENNEELTYFNLQKFMSRHFPKTVATPAPVVETA
jgi:chromatin remodeling complex protein RSC6